MNRRVALPIAVSLSLLAACKGEEAAKPAAVEALTYDGATTISSRILPDALPLFQQKTGIRFARIGTSGAGKGLKAALAGEVSVAGVTRSLSEEELAKKPYYQIFGYDALGLFVNEANAVRGLTKAQVKAMYTGQIKNWKEVGGKDLPVVVCTERLDSGRATLDAVRTMALDGAAYGPTKELEDPSDCLKLMVGDPAVVTAATVAYAIPGARPIALDGVEPVPANVRSGAYLLSRPMLLVARSVPSGALKQFFDFMLSPDGQAIVGKKFVAIR
jgi:phosphate transport system substrate-binding protein